VHFPLNFWLSSVRHIWAKKRLWVLVNLHMGWNSWCGDYGYSNLHVGGREICMWGWNSWWLLVDLHMGRNSFLVFSVYDKLSMFPLSYTKWCVLSLSLIKLEELWAGGGVSCHLKATCRCNLFPRTTTFVVLFASTFWTITCAKVVSSNIPLGPHPTHPPHETKVPTPRETHLAISSYKV
jgi:hypothetical protein